MHQKKYIMGVFDVHLSIVTVYIAKLDLEGMRIVCIASSRACGAEVVEGREDVQLQNTCLSSKAKT